MSGRRILIVGGSTRAAADSVRRAGWLPICADLFADLDLRATAEVIPVSQYPDSLPVDVKHVQADGWFYCGALENYPEIVSQISACNCNLGPLLGTSAVTLKRVRDPFWLASVLRNAGLPSLNVRSQLSPPIPDGTWLQKPLAGAGGRLIRVWDERAAQSPSSEPCYFQRRVAGVGLSALFRAQNGEFDWLGSSRELTMSFSLQPPTEFTYCGSVGPHHLIPNRRSVGNTFGERTIPQSQSSPEEHDFDREVTAQLTAIAELLVRQLPGLNGLIGLDFRLDNDTVWLTEVNPRYTASVEVLELATGRSFLNPNAPTNEIGKSPSAGSRPRVIAKQILYATQTIVAPDLSRFLPSADPWQIPMVADIPMPGILVEQGWPICTILAPGETLAEAESKLRQHVGMIQRELNGSSATTKFPN